MMSAVVVAASGGTWFERCRGEERQRYEKERKECRLHRVEKALLVGDVETVKVNERRSEAVCGEHVKERWCEQRPQLSEPVRWRPLSKIEYAESGEGGKGDGGEEMMVRKDEGGWIGSGSDDATDRAVGRDSGAAKGSEIASA